MGNVVMNKEKWKYISTPRRTGKSSFEKYLKDHGLTLTSGPLRREEFEAEIVLGKKAFPILGFDEVSKDMTAGTIPLSEAAEIFSSAATEFGRRFWKSESSDCEHEMHFSSSPTEILEWREDFSKKTPEKKNSMEDNPLWGTW